MVHFMDINNPNRDLSDPNWISAGAWHHEVKKQRERVKIQSIKPKPVQTLPKKLRVFWQDEDEKFEYIEIFVDDLECDQCSKVGAYYIEHSDPVGICIEHLLATYDKIEVLER